VKLQLSRLFYNTRIIVDRTGSEVYFPAMKLEEAAKQLEALGNPTRLAIYRFLIRFGQQGSPVGTIRKKLDIPASTLSHHISKLFRTTFPSSCIPDLLRRSGTAAACIAGQISRIWML
jgi:hypothetical protein